MNKAKRILVFNKCDGRCAYCGIVAITLWSRSSVSALITGKADVNAKRAIVLDQVFDSESLGPMYWMNLQAAYDLWRAGYRSER